jgi:hypothetical protein
MTIDAAVFQDTSTMGDHVCHVFPMRSVCQVAEARVGFVPIQVTHFHAIWTGSDKGQHH